MVVIPQRQSIAIDDEKVWNMASSSSSSARVMEKAKEDLIEQQQQLLKCPRCDSSNTKFCYYNNYSLSQPRHFCKACKRYWTRGGTLRNVPVGGGCRKNKRVKRPPPIIHTTTSHVHVSSNSTSSNHIINPLFYNHHINNLPFPSSEAEEEGQQNRFNYNYQMEHVPLSDPSSLFNNWNLPTTTTTVATSNWINIDQTNIGPNSLTSLI